MPRGATFAGVCAGAFIAAASSAQAGGQVTLFSQLEANDVVIVHYESRGCFRSESFELTFFGGESPMVVVREVGTKWRPATIPPTEDNTRPMTLTATDLRHLDQTLLFYRTLGTPSFCTTRDDIRLTQYRSRRLIAVESFHDGTCAGPTLAGFVSEVRWRIHLRQSAEYRAATR